MMSQQKMRAMDEGIRPAAAFAMGRASMPPPMEVPTMSRTPPINFEIMLYFVFMASGIGGGGGAFFPVHHWISMRRL